MSEYTNTLQALFIDLATIDFMEEMFLNAATASRVSYFVRTSTPCTPFTVVPIPLQSQGSSKVRSGGSSAHTVSRSGDYLLHNWLRITLPALTAEANKTVAWVPKIAHNLVQQITCEFNDMNLTSVIDTAVLDAWAAFHVPASKQGAYDEMIGNTSDLTDFSPVAGTIASKVINLPLPFFWAADTGKGLPTAALPYNDIVMRCSFKDFSKCILAADSTAAYALEKASSANVTGFDNLELDVRAWGEYAIVTNDERSMMAAAPRDIVVDFWQSSSEKDWASPSADNKGYNDIRYGGSVKAVYVAARNKGASAAGNVGSNYLDDLPSVATGAALPATVTTQPSGRSAIADLTLQYENTPRAHVPADISSLVTPYHHCPAVNRGQGHQGWHVISYTTDTGSLDPAGSSNFGKLTNVSLAHKATTAAVASGSAFSVVSVAQMWDVVRVHGGTLGRPIVGL